jgi:hypothetical protein
LFKVFFDVLITEDPKIKMFHKSNNQSHIMDSRTVVLNFTVKKITFLPQCRLSQELRCAAGTGACSQLATRPTTSRPHLATG